MITVCYREASLAWSPSSTCCSHSDVPSVLDGPPGKDFSVERARDFFSLFHLLADGLRIGDRVRISIKGVRTRLLAPSSQYW